MRRSVVSALVASLVDKAADTGSPLDCASLIARSRRASVASKEGEGGGCSRPDDDAVFIRSESSAFRKIARFTFSKRVNVFSLSVQNHDREFSREDDDAVLA